jgi:MSHA biogenesis protein MshJ
VKASIAKWAERYEAFSLRERMLIAGAVLVFIYMLWDAMLMSPEHLRQKNMVGEMYGLNQQMEEMDTQILTFSQKLSQGESQQMGRRLQDMREALTRLEQQQQELTVEFIRPEQMAGVLRGMLGAESGLVLTQLQSLGAEPLFPPVETKEGVEMAEARGPQIFKHGMRVTFEGDFFATLRYLQALEDMPWRFYWDGLEYRVLQYPKARVTITVHTLSLEKGWIGV